MHALVRAGRRTGLGLALALLAGSVQAAPLTLVVDPAQSDITLDIDIEGLLNPSGTAIVSGSLDADIDLTAGTLQATGAALAFSDLDMSDSIFGESVQILTEDVVANLTGGPAFGTLVGSGTYDFDLNGFLLSLNAGTMTTIALGETTEADLSTSPLDLPFTTSVATLVATDLGGGLFEVVLAIVVSESVSTVIEGFDVTVFASGPIVASGILDTGAVPEPAGAALVGLVLAGLAALRRRAA